MTRTIFAFALALLLTALGALPASAAKTAVTNHATQTMIARSTGGQGTDRCHSDMSETPDCGLSSCTGASGLSATAPKGIRHTKVLASMVTCAEQAARYLSPHPPRS